MSMTTASIVYYVGKASQLYISSQIESPISRDPRKTVEDRGEDKPGMLPCEERIDRCKRKRKLIKISIGPSPDLYTFGQPSSLSIRRLPPLENVSIEMAQSVSSSPPATDITGLGENKSYGTMGIARSPLDDWSDGVELERKGPSSSSHVFCEDFAGQTCCCGER